WEKQIVFHANRLLRVGSRRCVRSILWVRRLPGSGALLPVAAPTRPSGQCKNVSSQLVAGAASTPGCRSDTENAGSRARCVLVVHWYQLTCSVDTTSSSPPRRHRLYAVPLKDKVGWFLTEPTRTSLG